MKPILICVALFWLCCSGFKSFAYLEPSSDLAKSAATTPTPGANGATSFTEALAEATRLGDTDAGKAYDGEFGKVVAPRLSDVVSGCTKNLGPKIKFDVVFVFAADGQVQQVLGPSDQPAAACVGDKLRDLRLPAPPRANWPVRLSINISPDNAPTVLTLALKLMKTGTWEVDASISRGMKMRVRGLIAGEDFDLTLEPEGRNAVRQIAIKDKIWVSYDGSKTWKLEAPADHATFRRVYAFVHDPVRAEATLPALEVTEQQQRDGETWMHLRRKIAGKKNAELQPTEYWIAINQDPQRNGVRRYEGPVTEPGHEKESLHCVATYQPANDKTIQPPSKADPLPKKDNGQSALPDVKVVADNLEFSREFYSGVHLSAIAESAPSFAYQRYPDNGPERIQCDAGTFAREHGKPWLRSEDWGRSGRSVDQQMARKLDGWVKLVETAFDFTPSETKLVNKSRQGVSVEWTFEARAANQTGASVRLTFARPLYDKNQNVLLHEFQGSLSVGGKTGRAARVKFSFGYFVAASGFELSEAAWENLETPKELENKPIDLAKIDMGSKPNDAEGFLNRASARGFNGDMNGAIADLSRAIELDPKSEPAVYKRGAFKLQKGDYDGAIGDLSRAIELSPKTADYYSDRGLAKVRKRDNDGAIVDFTRAIELDAKNAIAYRNRALVKNIKGDADGALADYNRAIELDPKNAGAFNSRGAIKKSKGDLDGAISDFSRAIELNDKFAIAYKNRGETKQAKGDAAGAKEDLQHAGELDPRLMSKDER